MRSQEPALELPEYLPHVPAEHLQSSLVKECGSFASGSTTVSMASELSLVSNFAYLEQVLENAKRSRVPEWLADLQNRGTMRGNEGWERTRDRAQNAISVAALHLRLRAVHGTSPKGIPVSWDLRILSSCPASLSYLSSSPLPSCFILVGVSMVI